MSLSIRRSSIFSYSVFVIAGLLLAAAATGQVSTNRQERTGGYLEGTPCPPANYDSLLPTFSDQSSRAAVPVTLEPLPTRSPGAATSAPATGLSIDSDRSRSLPGFSGKLYEVDQVDGSGVVALGQTVRIIPTASTWLYRALIRNHTCQPTQVDRITATLFGSTGEVIEVISAVPFIKHLRPGEPAPFELESSVPPLQVASISWNIELASIARSPSRQYRLKLIESRPVLSNEQYILFGTITNTAGEVSRVERGVAAWLNSDHQVVYFAPLEMRRFADPANPKQALTLEPGETGILYKKIDDPALVWLLSGTTVMLWSASE